MSTTTLLLRTGTAELLRLRTVRSTWWFLAAYALFMVGLGAALGFEAAADPVELQGEPAWMTVRYLTVAGQFALLGLALTAVTSDYATGGIVPALQWTPRRTLLLMARWSVLLVLAAGSGVVLAVLAALTSATTSGGALTLRADDGLDMVAAVGVVLAAGVTLAVGLGFLLRSTGGGLVTAFLLMLVLPLILPQLGSWMTDVAEVLPGSGAVYLLFDGDGPDLSTTSALSVLIGWAAAALLLGWWRLVRDDANR
jgi:ABC-2 type transport system permease protein